MPNPVLIHGSNVAHVHRRAGSNFDWVNVEIVAKAVLSSGRTPQIIFTKSLETYPPLEGLKDFISYTRSSEEDDLAILEIAMSSQYLYISNSGMSHFSRRSNFQRKDVKEFLRKYQSERQIFYKIENNRFKPLKSIHRTLFGCAFTQVLPQDLQERRKRKRRDTSLNDDRALNRAGNILQKNCNLSCRANSFLIQQAPAIQAFLQNREVHSNSDDLIQASEQNCGNDELSASDTMIVPAGPNRYVSRLRLRKARFDSTKFEHISLQEIKLSPSKIKPCLIRKIEQDEILLLSISHQRIVGIVKKVSRTGKSIFYRSIDDNSVQQVLASGIGVNYHLVKTVDRNVYSSSESRIADEGVEITKMQTLDERILTSMSRAIETGDFIDLT